MKFNIKSDARRIKQGDTFVALKTVNGDGHKYILDAISNGASKVIAMYGNYSVETVIVPDTNIYLKNYLIDNYKETINKLTLIGVTGTNGKTTTSLLIYQALNKLNTKCASIGTIGYFKDHGRAFYLANTSPDICLLYELLMDAYNDDYKMVTLEASSRGLELNRLEGLEFDYTIFTNLTRDHLDEHKTMENYMSAKMKLFKMLKPSGIGIINKDDPNCDKFISDNNITYGFTKSDYQVVDYKMDIEGTEFKLNNEIYKTTLLGEYNISNLLPVIIILEDMKLDNIKSVISSLKLPSGRIERIKYLSNNIYIDYAHTPDGLEKAVSTIKKVTKGKTYVVFCCRGNRDIGRRKGMMEAATSLADYAIVTNDNIYDENPISVINDMIEGISKNNYEICLDRKTAIYKGIDLLNENDSLLVLGHGHEETLILENKEKISFIEKDIINEYIKDKIS